MSNIISLLVYGKCYHDYSLSRLHLLSSSCFPSSIAYETDKSQVNKLHSDPISQANIRHFSSIIDTLYHQVLPVLVRYYQSIHGSTVFTRPDRVVSNWLYLFISLFVVRSSQIHPFIEHHRSLNTLIIVQHEDSHRIPATSNELNQSLYHDSWNEHFYLKLIHLLYPSIQHPITIDQSHIISSPTRIVPNYYFSALNLLLRFLSFGLEKI